MKASIGIGLMCAALLLAAESPLAHHSFSAAFDLSKKFKVFGTFTKMDWRNPHIELFLDVKDEQGRSEAWMIESMPPTFFRNRTIGKVDFETAIGKTLTVEGVRARDGSPTGIAEKITFSDGRSITVWEAEPKDQ